MFGLSASEITAFMIFVISLAQGGLLIIGSQSYQDQILCSSVLLSNKQMPSKSIFPVTNNNVV